MDFAAVLASPVEFHPLATDAATGQSTDLRPLIADSATLRLALRASAALPLLAGPPVDFAGRRFYDAGVSESVPYRTALAQGATHLLILRSRRALLPPPDSRSSPDGGPSRPCNSARPSRSSRLLARTTLRRETPALRAAFLARESRRAADDQLLADYESASRLPSTSLISPANSAPPESRTQSASPTLPASPASPRAPAVFSIRPGPGSPEVSRLATDGALLRAALQAGREAARAALQPYQGSTP
jgi:predicted acylesterase/phospholipase RssA